MSASSAFLATSSRDESPLLVDLKAMLVQHANSFARNSQRAIGPSEVGHPCDRQLAAKLAGVEAVMRDGDPLPAYIGTAAHASMEDAAKLANRLLGYTRWLPETKVYVTDTLSGTCDLYDADTDTVVDFKFPGATAMTKYRKDGPSRVYRIQAHLYGRGYRNAGRDVKNVGIWFLPRGGFLSGSKLWTEPYDDALVETELARLSRVQSFVDTAEVAVYPDRLKMVPKTPTTCQYCPLFDPAGVTDYGCDGEDAFAPKITEGGSMLPPTPSERFLS